MNSVIEAVPTRSTVSRETISTRFFRISYLTAIVFWTIGWISALSWITVRLARWEAVMIQSAKLISVPIAHLIAGIVALGVVILALLIIAEEASAELSD